VAAPVSGRAALLLAAALLCSRAEQAAAARTWYVDCASGDDHSDGSSPQTAWRSTARVSAQDLGPGDAVLFRRDTICRGMLSPKGSGTAAAPIRLDAFGSGPLPRIEAVPEDKAALTLTDQEYWTVQHLEFSGGNPYGVLITGTAGVLHGIRVRDIVVHDVTGEPKTKNTGLLVISPGTPAQRFDGVVVDGVTAYRTTQWAGILVGDTLGTRAVQDRSTNVVVRNSIVADVAGDGIVLFQVNNGLIENSVAWYTGMQHTQTIGTPNAIWTWMCRDCTVRRCEAFLADSPGVDGGAFDIDYGDENNVVEDSYAHDTQGYCVAVFGAGGVTSYSVVRNNICSGNGRSPRLARRQGAVFLDTWDDGTLSGVQLTGNRVDWTPPIRTAAIVNTARLTGANTFDHNTIESDGAPFVRSNSSLAFDYNTYRLPPSGEPVWDYGGQVFTGFQNWLAGSKQDAHGSFHRAAREPAKSGPCSITAFVSADADQTDSRGQIALLAGLHRQFPKLPVRIATSGAPRVLPTVIVYGESRQRLWRHEGITPPGELGMAVRRLCGSPELSAITLPDSR
jgi:hypothetical protein